MVTLQVNGKSATGGRSPDTPLLWTLRDVLGLTGTKYGCGMALCGACTVHVDGQPVRSCITPVSAVGRRRSPRSRRSARTASARPCRRPGSRSACPVAATASPARSCPPLRCSSELPSQRMPTSTRPMSGNICRCGTYTRIRTAIHRGGQLERSDEMKAPLDSMSPAPSDAPPDSPPSSRT